MGIKEIIDQSDYPLIKQDIIDGLRNLGLKKNDTIMVHSSLSSFGYVVNGANDIIEALMEVVSDGTIIMPGHNSVNSNVREWRNPPVPQSWFEIVEQNIRPASREVEPVSIGKIPRVFGRYEGVKYTNHPFVALQIYGKGPKALLEQPLNRPHSMNGPFGYLYHNQVKLLMLGSDYDNLTFMHLASNILNSYMDMYSNIYQDGKIVRIKYDIENDEPEDFIKIGKSFEETKKDFIKIGKIGKATCRLIDGKELIDFTVEYYKKHGINHRDE
ncbi:MAG: AAC(3) family N-acetyltransferase [Acholeplasmataceae bacterium]|nr:AAC(3) family N-acetyltransferase [Acholeplasmataceae bacterium]